jgi:hypothetical protein
MRLALILTLLLAFPGAASAQAPDFLFGRPPGGLVLRTGWLKARAGSDLYDFVEKQLTVERRDFDGPSIGVDFDFAIAPRTMAVAGFDFNGMSVVSEYRGLVDNNRLPIKQTTSMKELNLSGGIKFDLTPRGRAISPHAWIPSLVTPYVGAGAGVMKYVFTQNGDFVDFLDQSVFPHTFESKGWAPSAQVFGGVDVKVLRRLYLNGEGRYLWSHASLDADFSGFKPIDLAGFRMTAGVRYLF